VLKALTPGRTYTLRDLATLMIIVSDNTATNLLIDRLGVEAINERCLRHGWHGTRLFGKLQTGDATETSHTTPADLCSYFAQLWRGDLLPPALTGVAQDIFRRQQLTDGLGGDLDYDRYSTETGASQLIVASKSGSIRGVRNDAGVIELAGRGFVVAVMTKGGTDPRFYPGNPGVRTIAKVARALYDHFGLSAEQSA
jgi:beta-lactamase class A